MNNMGYQVHDFGSQVHNADPHACDLGSQMNNVESQVCDLGCVCLGSLDSSVGFPDSLPGDSKCHMALVQVWN